MKDTATPSVLDELPGELLDELQQAAFDLDINASMAVIEKIRLLDSKVAGLLTRFASTYQFDKVYTIIKSQADQRGMEDNT